MPTVMAICIMALELSGGLLLLAGLGRWLGLLPVAEFVVVVFYVQVLIQGWFGSRLPLMLLAGALILVVAGLGTPDGGVCERRQGGYARGARGCPRAAQRARHHRCTVSRASPALGPVRHEYGGGDPPGAHRLPERLVCLRATGVTPLDWKIHDGFKAIEHVHFRWILSQDAAGIVVPLRPSVTGFAVGAAVYDDSGL